MMLAVKWKMESTQSTKQVSEHEQHEVEAWPGTEAGIDGVVYDVPRAGAGGGAEAGVAAVQAGGPARAAAAGGAGGVHAGPHLGRVYSFKRRSTRRFVMTEMAPIKAAVVGVFSVIVKTLRTFV